jgi:hypothetical protein
LTCSSNVPSLSVVMRSLIDPPAKPTRGPESFHR